MYGLLSAFSTWKNAVTLALQPVHHIRHRMQNDVELDPEVLDELSDHRGALDHLGARQRYGLMVA